MLRCHSGIPGYTHLENLSIVVNFYFLIDCCLKQPAVRSAAFFVYLLQQKFRNMKSETKKKIWESLDKLEKAWDEHRQNQAIRRAYLFRDPTKKKYFS